MRWKNKIIYKDDKILKFLIESKIYGDKEVIIDVEDWNRVKHFRWYFHFACLNYF